MEGKSLAPIFQDQPRPGQEWIGWEHFGARAIRQSDWKLVARKDSAWELYDLSNDRTELNDLSAQHPEKAAELKAAYDEWARRCGVEEWPVRPRGR